MMVCKRCGYVIWGGSSPGRVLYLDDCQMCTEISNTSDEVLDSAGRDRGIEEKLVAKTEKLLQLHADGCLPGDIALTHVPIEQTAFGDYQIALPPPGTGPIPDWAEEHAEEYTRLYLRWYIVRGQHFFAGYDDVSGTLVIGTRAPAQEQQG